MIDAYPDKCPRCGGQILSDYGRAYCLQCSHSPMGVKEKREWFKAHKAAILKDWQSIGAQATQEKWHLDRFTLATAHRGKGKERPAGAKVAPQANHNQLPPFPSFSDSWDPKVQTMWLEIYMELATGKEKS
jgi:hypothetical protein